MSSQIKLIAAMNQQRVIGSNNQLPWHIPEDLAYFKQTTLGKPVIMGRKTFESIGRVLPERKNIVISHLPYIHAGVFNYHSLQEALKKNEEAPEIFVIGGGEIFKEAIKVADYLHITEVQCVVENPCAWFPEISEEDWELITSCEFISVSGIKCMIKEYRRR